MKRNIKIVFDNLLMRLLFFWHSERFERTSFGKKKKSFILFLGLMVLFTVGTDVVLRCQVTLWATRQPGPQKHSEMGQEEQHSLIGMSFQMWVSDHLSGDTTSSHRELLAAAEEDKKNLQLPR